MGLDLVELVMEIEEAFGMSIPDRDAAGLETVGQVYDYILEHRFQGKQEACMSNITFYKIRRALTSVLHIPRNDVRVATALENLIPDRRRRSWFDLEKSIHLRLPKLKRPFWVILIATLVTFGLGIAAFFLLFMKLGANAVCVAFITTLAAGFVLIYTTEPLAVLFSSDCATVGQFTKATLALNYGAISDEYQRYRASEVWDSLCSIISEQLGVPRNILKRETHFVKDLHAD
jgi:hypothetical protein